MNSYCQDSAESMDIVSAIGDGLRGTQDMVVVGESAVNEASTPIDYVGSGSQVITLNIN
jgi:hypothetical protein